MAEAVSEQKIARINQFLETFQRNNTHPGLTFYVNEQPVGVIRLTESVMLALHARGSFRIDEDRKEIHMDGWQDFGDITAGLEGMLTMFWQSDLFVCLRGWRDEKHDVAKRFGERAMFRIERAATPLFGLKRYGVHINGFVRKDDRIESVWLQRRSKTKQQFPDVLDIIVSGGLEAGFTPLEAVHKECFEEASITREFCEKHVKPVGAVSFVYEDDLGTHPLTFFCYDASLPADFEPKANDGEVEEFVQIPIGDLLDTILDPKRFKVTSAPTVLDFLVRHHVIDSTYGSAFLKIISTIHQNIEDDYPVW